MIKWKKAAALLLAGVMLGTGSGYGTVINTKAAEWALIQSDVPDWKEAITEAFGEEAIAGFAATQSELNDKAVFELITKHANSVTFGNELKPDCLFGYSNDRVPGTEEIEFNGSKMIVPKADFSRADGMLKKLKAWNEENPENIIHVRGHVLLWHSQTPEWFFHEDYDKNKEYVDKATMNRRLEWYISMVLNHYVGEDSPYKDMFYGWDVVNEAVTDNGEVYRTDTEGGNDKLSDSTHGSKSSWWHVYESNEFIINAFKYANKYAPATLELYYNDYGDISPQKKERILTLIRAVKEQEGAAGEGTRISGFGMQGHYDMNNFSIGDFETAAREYAQVAGSVQLTELDFKASSSFDNSDAAKETEYVAQAGRYQQIFEVYKKLAKEGCNIRGITFWGTVDKYSWLQSRSNVGGGADGSTTQCPLLFDDDYQIKPAFWAFVDPSQIVPPIKKVFFTRTADGNFSRMDKFTYSAGTIEVEYVPLWNEEGLQIQYTVTDREKDDNDAITFYVDEQDTRSEGITPTKVTVTRAESKSAGGGYKGTVTVPLAEPAIGKCIGFDIAVTSGEEKGSLNDFNGNQDTDSKCYAKGFLLPERAVIATGTPDVDGVKEELWKTTKTLPLTIGADATRKAGAKLLWDVKNLYVYAQVADASPDTADSDPLKQDYFEICIDEKNEKAFALDQNDKIIRINADGTVSAEGKAAKAKDVVAVVNKTAYGYDVEVAIPWKEITPKVHGLVGLELRVHDTKMGETCLGWANAGEEVLTNPALYGTGIFAVEGEPLEEEDLMEGLVAAEEEGATEEGQEESINLTEKENELSEKPDATLTILTLIAAALALCGLARKESKKKK